MKMSIAFQMDNAAFDDTGEAPHILRKLANHLDTTVWSRTAGENGPIMDANGNKVGIWEVTP